VSDDVQINLTPAAFQIELAPEGPQINFQSVSLSLDITNSPPIEIQVAPANFNFNLSSAALALELAPVNFNLEFAPPNLGLTILDGTCYEIDVVQPDINFIFSGPPGPPGPASTVPGPPGAQGVQGATGAQGVNAFTATAVSSFTVPAVGFTTTVTVTDASWVVVGQLLYFDTAGGGIGQAGALVVSAKSGNTLTVLNPVPPPIAGGGGGGTVSEIWGETPGGTIDGSNKNFTTANPYRANLSAVFLNGLRQRRVADYNETGTQSFSFVNAPLPGDSLSIDYIQP
jgi:hypothetical protein